MKEWFETSTADAGRLAGPPVAKALCDPAHDPRHRHRARVGRRACTYWCRTFARRAVGGATRSTWSVYMKQSAHRSTDARQQPSASAKRRDVAEVTVVKADDALENPKKLGLRRGARRRLRTTRCRTRLVVRPRRREFGGPGGHIASSPRRSASCRRGHRAARHGMVSRFQRHPRRRAVGVVFLAARPVRARHPGDRRATRSGSTRPGGRAGRPTGESVRSDCQSTRLNV